MRRLSGDVADAGAERICRGRRSPCKWQGAEPAIDKGRLPTSEFGTEHDLIASITAITAATIESVAPCTTWHSLEECLERTRTTEGIPFTAERYSFRADSTRLHSVRQDGGRIDARP